MKNEFPIKLTLAEIEQLLPQKGIALYLLRGEVDKGSEEGVYIAHGEMVFPPDHPLIVNHFGIARGVDLVEMCGQTASLILSIAPQFQGLTGMFVRIEAVFRGNVRPGELIKAEAVIDTKRIRHKMGTFTAKAWLAEKSEKPVVETTVKFVIGKPEEANGQ